MTSLTVTQARANLFKLLEQTALSHEPIYLTGRRQNGVLISAGDFQAMQETLHLLSVPGLKDTLPKSKKAPLKSFSKMRPWWAGSYISAKPLKKAVTIKRSGLQKKRTLFWAFLRKTPLSPIHLTKYRSAI